MKKFTLGNITVEADTLQEAARACASAFVAYQINNYNMSVDEIKILASEKIKYFFEEKRAEYITLTPGKVQEYQEKRDEWRRWSAAGKPATVADADYPIAAAEAIEYSITTRAMLVVYGNKVAQWIQATATIAALERRALRGIENATSIEDVAGILALLA